MKLLLDEMLDATIAEQLRHRGHDVEATQAQAGLEGKKDTKLLRAARELDRVVVTGNVRDFVRLHRQFWPQARTTPASSWSRPVAARAPSER
ncbi:MAG: DUF5615 family PIN-like protein [Candidatus Dormibacteraeota bacterium]|nr:DUF5615 family PIN-like protein [Candidatus Dormibacteraeota bacterium]